MGMLASIGHFLLILAYGRTPAATLTPYLYTQIGFAVLGGWVVSSICPTHGPLLAWVWSPCAAH